ncbi:MAG: protein translocase subunit SecF [Limnochordia bacterium]|jgi:preprotein translocase subunit SecF
MRFDIVGRRKTWLGLAGCLVLFSIILLMTKGLNLGIDFTGGALLERGLGRPATAAEVAAVLEEATFDMGSPVIQPLADGREVLIRTKELTPEEIAIIDGLLAEAFDGSQIRRTEVVGPVIGEELVSQALMASFLACLGVLAYVTVRFEFLSGLAAILALIFDVLTIVGAFILLGWEVNTPFVAAVLTVIGYSINNTIVLFDRVRENLQYAKGKVNFPSLVNDSIWETMARSINTSITTLSVVICLFLFGGETIKDFTLALIIGLTAGFYSSVFIASNLWVTWRRDRDGSATA